MQAPLRILALLVLFTVAFGRNVAQTSTWKTLDTNGHGPLPRDAIAAHAFGDIIFTFGGFNENLDPLNPVPNVFYNDVWTFDTDSKKWAQRHPLPDQHTGTFPSPRAYSIAGKLGNEFIVGFGITYAADFSNVVAYNDLWGYNTETNRWRLIRAQNNVGGPGPRAEVDAVVYKKKLYLFGGATAQFATKDDTWVYDFDRNNWTQITAAPAPSPRYGSVVALDDDNERMIIYGGERSIFTATGVEFEFSGPDAQWQFDLNTLRWTEIVPLYQLPDRNNGNGAVFHSGLFFIFGGDIGGGQICSDVIFQQNNVNETWVWDSAINVWVQLCPSVAPLNFKRAVSVLVDKNVYMFGGFSFDTSTCGPFIYGVNVYRYSLDGCFGGNPCAQSV